MSYSRAERVGDLIKKEIAELLQHGDIKDPRVGFVTITRVKMSRDLKLAHVFFSMLGDDEQQRRRSREGLMSACGFIRRRLAKSLDLKHIPVVDFLFDDSIEYGSRIERILRDIREDDEEGR
ncbi:MAG TPA: 30S ribosome-binding factor RbfA [Deltaproteobacteria bacterium]|nr:30S ribosome-binding factor RbfA [Deltaproteobacteria bacterium]